MILRLINEYETLPRPMRLGLIVFAFGGFLNVLYYASPSGWMLFLNNYLGTNGSTAHLVTLAGMVVVMLGVFRTAFTGARRSRDNDIKRKEEPIDRSPN